MRRAFLSSLTILTLLMIGAGCRSAADTKTSETQRQFGVRMARMNLWREAMFRFRRAVQIDPQDAEAHNNLAVALEANGDFDAAAKEYREALRLDRTNTHIQKNYSRFMEFTQKAKKREANAPATSTAATTTTTPTTPAVVPVPPAAPLDPPIADPETPRDPTTTNPPDGGSR